jgi:hypothetical protein
VTAQTYGSDDLAEAKLAEALEPDNDSFGLSIVPLDGLRTEARAPWLVNDVIREQSSVLLHGKTGTYKTFLVLDLFASLVVGRPWLGNEMKRQGPVLYVAAEGVETIAERLDAWCQQNGESVPSEQFQVMTTPAQLHDPLQALYLLAWIELHQPIAVAIDTLSKSMGPGTDENSNSDMTAVHQPGDEIRQSRARWVRVRSSDEPVSESCRHDPAVVPSHPQRFMRELRT